MKIGAAVVHFVIELMGYSRGHPIFCERGCPAVSDEPGAIGVRSRVAQIS